jgi:hypothetical protein
MGSLCRKLKKNGRKFWGEKGRSGSILGVSWREGFFFAGFLGRLLGELLIFPLRLVLLSCCEMS